MIKHLFLSLLFSAACSEAHSAPQNKAPAPPSPNASEPAKLAVGSEAVCPVTGEKFKVKEGTSQVVYNGKRYAFCCADCLPDWNKNPGKYAM